MMASPSPNRKFRPTLLKVSESLTEKNIKDLAFLCEAISPARREQLKDGTDLFAALQGHDLLHERKVDVLIGWLDELHLSEASKLLKEYSQENSLEYHSLTREKCLIHEDLPLKYFCVSCNSRICPDCVIKSHGRGTRCEVIPLHELRKEVTKRREKLTAILKDANGSAATIKGELQQVQKIFVKCFDLVNDKSTDEYFALKEKLRKKQAITLQQFLDERLKLQFFESSLGDLKRKTSEPPTYSLPELQKMVKAMSEIDELNSKIKEQKRRVQTLSKLVGCVRIKKDQMVIIADERQVNGSVLLTCINPSDPSKEHWRHAIKVDDHQSSVVMSYIRMWYANNKHVLFAVSKTVFIVQPHWAGSLYDSVESVTPVVIKDVPECSWITSVTANRVLNESHDEFIISLHNSKTIREYNSTGKALRVIDVNDFLSSNGMKCVAYSESTFAIIGSENDDVILVSADDGAVRQCGTFSPPSVSLLPVIVIRCGGEWLVLFISDGAERQWKVVRYNTAGKLVKVCHEGTSSSDLDVPVSITRWVNTGYIILANNTIRAFKIR